MVFKVLKILLEWSMVKVNTLIWLVFFGALLILIPLNLSASGSVHYHYHSDVFLESGSAEAMVADVVIARPIGLVSTIVGSTVYVVSLPFSLLGGNEKQAREKLVKEPSEFTFKRPLGEFPSLRHSR